MKKNFQKLDLLAKLEAKRAHLIKELEDLCKEIEKIKKDSNDTIMYFDQVLADVPFRKVNGEWEPAFEIILT